MAQVDSKRLVAVGADEKCSSIMRYCPTLLVKGVYVTTETVQVSAWLRTQAAPDYMHTYNAQVLMLGSSGPSRSIFFREYFIPTNACPVTSV